jgi:hypothetical protein
MENQLEPLTTDNRRLRLPPIRESHREAIQSYLNHMLDRIERTLNDHRALYMSDRSPALAEQIKYYANQVSTMRWLLVINRQRKPHVEVH